MNYTVWIALLLTIQPHSSSTSLIKIPGSICQARILVQTFQWKRSFVSTLVWISFATELEITLQLKITLNHWTSKSHKARSRHSSDSHNLSSAEAQCDVWRHSSLGCEKMGAEPVWSLPIKTVEAPWAQNAPQDPDMIERTSQWSVKYFASCRESENLFKSNDFGEETLRKWNHQTTKADKYVV